MAPPPLWALGGPVTITATLGAIQGTASLTVVDVMLTSIAVSPVDSTLPAGFPQAYVAMGTYNNGSVVDITALVEWESSDTDVATFIRRVNNSRLARNQFPATIPGTKIQKPSGW